VRLEIADNIRDLAIFNMAIDCKLRGCDLMRLKNAGRVCVGSYGGACVGDAEQDPAAGSVRDHGTDLKAVQRWIESPAVFRCDDLWPSRFHGSPHLSTWQYARILRGWITSIGLEPSAYGTQSMRRTKAAQIYKKTGNLRAVQLLLGHTKMDSTVRYLGIELEDALEISEGVEM
jgi:site-specific recombinase XerC